MRIQFDLGNGIDPETVYAFDDEWVGVLPLKGDTIRYQEIDYIVRRIIWCPSDDDSHVVTIEARKEEELWPTTNT